MLCQNITFLGLGDGKENVFRSSGPKYKLNLISSCTKKTHPRLLLKFRPTFPLLIRSPSLSFSNSYRIPPSIRARFSGPGPSMTVRLRVGMAETFSLSAFSFPVSSSTSTLLIAIDACAILALLWSVIVCLYFKL